MYKRIGAMRKFVVAGREATELLESIAESFNEVSRFVTLALRPPAVPSRGPLNPVLTDAVKGRIAVLKAAAEYQIGRVAKVRQLDPLAIKMLVNQNTEDRQWGLFGEPRVNVLKLNIALDSFR